jgi:hypothetical protein
MIFSELVSLFQDEISVLEQGLSEKRWSDFQDMLYDYDFLLLAKHPNTLDKIVPDLLMQKLAGLSTKKYVFDPKNNVLTLHSITDKTDSEILSMQAMIEKYGDMCLNEIKEKSAYKLPA